MTAKKRLLKYLEYKGISQYEFCKQTKLANGFFKSGDNISSKSLAIIKTIYLDLNLTWLIDGTGEKIISQEQNIKKYVIPETEIFDLMVRESNDDIQELHSKFVQALKDTDPEKFFYYIEDYIVQKNRYIKSLEEQVKLQEELLNKFREENKKTKHKK